MKHMCKKWLILLVIMAAGALLSGMGKTTTTGEVPRITVGDLQSELSAPDLVVIDVRVERDWKGSDRKIAGAVRENPANPQEWAGKYAKEKKLVLYCT